jgi:hypothetical protein
MGALLTTRLSLSAGSATRKRTRPPQAGRAQRDDEAGHAVDRPRLNARWVSALLVALAVLVPLRLVAPFLAPRLAALLTALATLLLLLAAAAAAALLPWLVGLVGLVLLVPVLLGHCDLLQ